MTKRTTRQVTRFQMLRDPMEGILADWFGLKHRPAMVLLTLYRSDRPLSLRELARRIGSNPRHMGQFITEVRDGLDPRERRFESLPNGRGGNGLALSTIGRQKCRKAFDWVANHMGLPSREEALSMRARIEALETALELPTPACADDLPVHLTRTEAKVYRVLASGKPISREALYHVVYADRLECEQPTPKIIDVMICKVRKKLPDDMQIATIWGEGYRLVTRNAA